MLNPAKVLAGFNISKIGPVVSLFNPVLAKYLVNKYLSGFDAVFDPFSGFSGRLIGAVAAGKRYIGQDLREVSVKESNEIIDFLKIQDKASIAHKDVLQSHGEYECLLTCPPYGFKEVYGDETVFKSCDGWIDECLDRFKCRRYVFIIDETEKYRDYISEELHNASHFSNSVEHIVVIDR